MIVLVEEAERPLPSDLQQNQDNSAEAARLAGAQVYLIPPDNWIDGSAKIPLSHVRHQENPTPAIRIGYRGGLESYRAIYEEAAQKNIFLINSPEQQRIIQEFELAYPYLEGMTPRVLIFSSLEEALEGAQQLSLPVLVRDAVKKRTHGKIKRAPVAQNLDELHTLCAQLFEPGNRAQGRVVLREEVALRHSLTLCDLPLGRIFSLLLFKGEILDCSYVWEGENDPLANLSPQERLDIEGLARIAAARLPAPYATIHIGQRENGGWIVTDTEDPQFSSSHRIVPPAFWPQLLSALSSSGS